MHGEATSITITCPHCSLCRKVPAEKVPEREVTVCCPRCGNRFPFGRPAALVPPAAGSGPSPGDLPPEAQENPAPSPPRLPRPAVPTPPQPDAAEQKPASLVLVALTLLVMAAAGWWLNFPPAASPVDGSYSDAKNKFSVKAPPDWILVTPDNYRSILEQYRDRIPKELAALVGRGTPDFSVSFMRIPAGETEYTPNFNVVMVDTRGRNLPRLTESEKDKAAETISREMSRQIRGYRMKEAKIVEIDGLDSLQIRGEAELTVVTKASEPIYSQPGAFGWRHVTGHTQAEKESYHLQALQTLVPGRKRGYAVSFMYDDLKTPEMVSVQRQVMESFRVLERPPRLGGIAMWALNGGMIGAGLYLVGILFGRLFNGEG